MILRLQHSAGAHGGSRILLYFFPQSQSALTGFILFIHIMFLSSQPDISDYVTGFAIPNHNLILMRNQWTSAVFCLLCAIYSSRDSHYICFSLVIDSSHKKYSLPLSFAECCTSEMGSKLWQLVKVLQGKMRLQNNLWTSSQCARSLQTALNTHTQMSNISIFTYWVIYHPGGGNIFNADLTGVLSNKRNRILQQESLVLHSKMQSEAPVTKDSSSIKLSQQMQ